MTDAPLNDAISIHRCFYGAHEGRVNPPCCAEQAAYQLGRRDGRDEERARWQEERGESLHGPETRQRCDCGRAFCGGAELAARVGRSAPQSAQVLGSALAQTYTYAATAYAQHGSREGLACGPGWVGVALDVDAAVKGERERIAHAVLDLRPRALRDARIEDLAKRILDGEFAK